MTDYSTHGFTYTVRHTMTPFALFLKIQPKEKTVNKPRKIQQRYKSSLDSRGNCGNSSTVLKRKLGLDGP